MLLNRYISKSLIYPILLVIFTFTFLVWLTQSLRFIDFIVNKGIDVGIIFTVTMLMMPTFINMVLPISVCIGIVFFYHKMMNDNEITVMKSIGQNNFAIAKPGLYVASIATLIGFAFSCFITPTSASTFQEKKRFLQHNYAAMVLQEGVFTEPIKGITIFIDQIENNSNFKGILVSDERDENKDVLILAKEAKVVNNGDQTIFELTSGNRQEKKDNKINVLAFDKFPVNISNFVKSSYSLNKDPEEMNIVELFKNLDKDSDIYTKMISEINNRIAWPLLNITLSLVALSILLKSKNSRYGYFKNVFKTSLAATVVTAGIVLLVMLSARNINLVPLIYVYLLSVSSVSMWQLQKN
ncbi:MAG: LptF/LptG family permease [Alphaproteobacteria bacterium]|nr:LptF/LptG family permease [Alphaproteobacteria bacterium]OJV13668.1 MAG: hypothetical protein BGO27_00655 [Alphaproteobacteria bacterium 33-17]